MKLNHLLFSAIIVSGAIFCQTAKAENLNSDKLKVYTMYGNAMLFGFDKEMDVYLMIDGKPVVAKNHLPENNGPGNYSYVEVDPSFNYKEINSAELTYFTRGHKYLCKADRLPAYVQDNEAELHFSCE